MKDVKSKLVYFINLKWFHWIVILGSILLTLIAWYTSKVQYENRIQARFDQEANLIINLIEERLRSYADALWAGAALYYTQDSQINHSQWKTFANSLNLKDKYPGISGIGVIFKVDQRDFKNFVSTQKRIRPDFHIHPRIKKDLYFPITFLEPEKENIKAIGLDIGFEKNRLEGAIKAQDTGKAQITGPINLVQEKLKVPGFLFYAPFYKGGVSSNQKLRQQNFEGMVYAAFVVSKLIYGTLEQERRLLDIKISDQGHVLYDEHTSNNERTPLLKQNIKLDVYGRTWDFEIRSTKKFEQAATSNLPITILFAGAIIDSLLLILFINMANSKSKAMELAKKMSHEASLQKKSAEQASKLAALGEMAGGIAHEINNPLNVIMTHSYFLSEIDKKNLSDEVAKELTLSTTKIESSVQRIITIVDGLRHFSRDGSQDALKKESVNSILKETIDFAKEGFKTKNVSIIYECFSDSHILCNRVQISQVLINLLNNAQFVASKSQEKEIHIRVNENPNNGNIVIKVSNSGEQIPKDLIGKIFQPFFTTKEAGQGTGIGLSISKNIIEAHDGKLYLDPHSTQTTFVIELPTVSS